MDNKLAINAVAGSGKTKLIIKKLSLKKRTCIITYTTANQNSLKERIEARFGYFPPNIHVFGYWEFLYSFCVTPLIERDFSGIIFDIDIQSKIDRKYNYNTPSIYMNKYFLTKTFAKWLLNSKINYLDRINYFFDDLFVDEVQDFASDDLDWITSLANLSIPVLLVGDFFQQTYSTSTRGNKNKGIRSDKERWLNKLRSAGFDVDETSLIYSQRCAPDICHFIKDSLDIDIRSKKNTKNKQVLLIEKINQITEIMKDDKIVKLFFRNSLKYKCVSTNWGLSKGLTFDDICVVLNPTTFKAYKKNQLTTLAPTTKSKLYVACTRGTGNLYFVEEKKIPKGFKEP
ncbi:RNA helicase [Pediococcus stilesii]|uniref:RNA helicase n=1 Tax=Pediococcus stilesii TaxID=331679 RepID=A0A5R9BTK7_9LACO|nr:MULTISPECIES: RNA helicase [Pediococcus]KAF0504826.1 RNA helicase [Pediococcus pentosaceus]MBF7131776.1 RNA helicase [Pediococcus pentosaceus]MBF7138778.1 RNA helicase [Pediococcus pentosaceus]TLQ03331.1 RNA helicase [Pediococcus stilesii]